MGYQTAWTDTKRWLENSIDYLKTAHKTAFTAEERQRLSEKMRAMNLVYGHMMDTEKIYDLCTHENAVIDGDSARDLYCPDCNKRLQDCSL